MRITESRIRHIIREEARHVLREGEGEDTTLAYLSGETHQTSIGGILKVLPNNPPTNTQRMAINYLRDERGIKLEPIPEDKLHITLMHQSLTKALAKKYKILDLPPFKGKITYDKKGVWLVNRDEKTSVFVVVDQQAELDAYVDSLGFGKDPGRVYHVSLANKTGDPGDSVGHAPGRPLNPDYDAERIFN